MPEALHTVRGASCLAFDLAEGIVNSVERMHETIARRPLPLAPPPPVVDNAHGFVAASVYGAIRRANAVLRAGVNGSMGALAPASPRHEPSRSEAVTLGWLNGVCGDHLEDTDNPLAIPMGFSTPESGLCPEAGKLDLPQDPVTPHIAVFVHGLCLSPWSWWRGASPSLGDVLRDEAAVTPVYLRYNSGRHISTNGRELAAELSRLCAAWPVPVQSLSLVGHSMGGLVIRSACWYAERDGASWTGLLERVVCLGTPHHGAALEKAGSLFDRTMSAVQYADPLLYGKHRSAGIRDLRHGNLLDEDWAGESNDATPWQDRRRPVPLLDGVDYYLVAASVGRDHGDPRGRLLGDFLVRVDSATGRHRVREKHLPVPPENCRVYHEASHFDLLDDGRVQAQLCEWFTRPRGSAHA